MTIYEFLRNRQSKHLQEAWSYFNNEKEFYKCIGRLNECGNLIDLLSDDILKTEVHTRAEVIMKG